jgi:GAF domain-containing protein
MNASPYQATLETLRATTNGSRVTLRLDTPGMNFPAVAEAVAPDVKPISSDNSLDQRNAATAQWLFATKQALIQDDCEHAEPAPPPELLKVYGVKAQMLGPIVGPSGDVIGWISVHYCPTTRQWSDDDIEALERARASIQENLAGQG